MNRELSWLKFDERVLSEARDKSLPLFERLKFLSITSSNLDEFFMVRVASLKDQVHAGYKKKDIAGMSSEEQLKEISLSLIHILDATNIIRNTVLAVLVPISMDHQAFLGNTLSEIAEKKAGIIKPGCSVVTVGQQPETMAVIERVCRENGADLTEADLHEAKAVKEDFAGQTLEYRGENYELALAGSYQTENAALALEALEAVSYTHLRGGKAVDFGCFTEI